MLKHRYKHSVSAFYNYSSENFWSSYTDNAGHRAWSGYSFEQVCLAHIKQIKKTLGISGVHTDVSSGSRTQENRPCAYNRTCLYSIFYSIIFLRFFVNENFQPVQLAQTP